MITTRRGGPKSQMTQPETFEMFYAKKLEALVIELKAVIKGDTPYTTNVEYACRICSGRLKLHSQGRIYCLKCSMPPVCMPSTWPDALKKMVFRILQGYPSLEESMQEYKALHAVAVRLPTPTEQAAKCGDVELGKKIQAAREKRGFTRDALAALVYRQDGINISRASIRGYEVARSRPSAYILAQLEQILEMDS